MAMKNIIFFAAVTMSFATLALTQEELLSKSIDELTPEQQEERHRIKQYQHTGGFLVKREINPGSFAIVNAQKKISSSVYADDLKEIQAIFKIDFSEQSSTNCVTSETALEALKASKSNAALFIVDNPKSKETIVLAPESRWGILNVAALMADKPATPVLEKRVKREIWRAFSMVAGSPYTEMNHCLLNPMYSLRELDEFDGTTIGPEPLGRCQKALRAMGIKQFFRASYKTACKQGWAPAPTNDVQKAIWDSVKAKQPSRK